MLTRIYYCLCAFYYRCHLLSIHDCELNKTFSPIDLSFAQIILKKIVFNNIDPNIKSLSTLFFNCLKKEFILLNCLILNPLLVCISFKKPFMVVIVNRRIIHVWECALFSARCSTTQKMCASQNVKGQ